MEVIRTRGGKPRNPLQFLRMSSEKDVKVCSENYLASELHEMLRSFYSV